MEEYIKAIADTGATVVVGNGSFGELALHFIERYGLMAIKIVSKFDLRRFCRTVNAQALVKLQTPQADELGFASSITVEEIGSSTCLCVRQSDAATNVSTVVLRGATESQMSDIERALDDGINAYRAMCKEPRLLPAGGATEVALSKRCAELARKEQGLEQYAIAKFGDALDIVPRCIAENASLNGTDAVATLHAAHQAGKTTHGVDMENVEATKDHGADGIYDLYTTKWWALKHVIDAVTTVLRVDCIIMSKQAGGPKGPPPGED